MPNIDPTIQPNIPPELAAMHLAGQLAGAVDLVSELERPLLALGGPSARALMSIIRDHLAPDDQWKGLIENAEALRQACVKLLDRDLARLADDDRPMPGQYL